MRKPLTVGSLIPGRQAPPVSLSNHRSSPSRSCQPEAMIRLKQNDTVFAIRPQAGQLLLDAALSQLQPLSYKCRKGSCGKCAVQLLAGSHLLSPPTAAEQTKLEETLQQGYRLACQTWIRPR